MGFLPLAIIVWLAAMLAWYVVSKYFKSSDADKVKQRLMGVARKQTKSAKDGQQSVIHTQQSGNKFAQLLVEKYQLGPKIQLLLEQFANCFDDTAHLYKKNELLELAALLGATDHLV